MKKGQGLSLNTIIIAAIVLIVLVVLWAIFTGRMAGFAGGLKETTGKTCDNVCQSVTKVKADCTTETAAAGFHNMGN